MKANIVHVWQDSSNKKMCVNFLGKRQCGFPRRRGGDSQWERKDAS